MVEPMFWQRASAARSPVEARRAVLVSVAFWAVFDFLTTTSGLYARALLPALDNPVLAFPELARATLPPLALGFFYVGMIATVMSTIDAYAFVAATTIGRDVIWRLSGRASDEAVPAYARIGMWAAAIWSVALALASRSVIGLWHDLGSIVTPVLLLPVSTALLGRGVLGPGWTTAAMLVPLAITLAWILPSILGRAAGHPFGVEPIYAGLAASLAIYAAGWLSRGAVARGTLVRAALAVLFLVAPAASARGADEPAGSDTLGAVVPIEGIEVSTARASDVSPTARSTVGRKALEKLNVGLDTPMALATLPGAYAYSDAGNGIGYSYLSVRGFQQRRVSVLVNGVPLNDPQSHEVYWVDHPDLLASTREVQLQRGVGSALYGAASVGGTVNIETSPFTRGAQAAAVLGYGSWETRRLMIEGNSGDLAGGWNLYGRYSRIESDGYRDDAFSRLWSYTLAARKQARAHSFRANFYGGPEETRLSYLGVGPDYLEGNVSGDARVDRRFNPITYPNERDHFFEPHYELIHAWTPNPDVAFSQTLFYFDGDGYYDEQRFARELSEFRLQPWQTADSTLLPRDYYRQDPFGNLVQDGQGRFTVERTDVVRRRSVENRHYGWIPRARVREGWGHWTVGGELRAADGRHLGAVTSGNGLPPGTPPDALYYDYHPWTLSTALFARAEWEATPQLVITGDVAWRHQAYYMRGDEFDGIRFDQTYDFVNPRAGVTWTPRPGLSTYASYARSGREPAFRDLYDAEGAGSKPLYEISDTVNNIYENPLVTPETVDDFELGVTWRGRDASATANLFRMNFREEIVFAGQYNTDLGYATVGNAARSVHQGIELAADASAPLGAGATLLARGNATLSDNRLNEYREFITVAGSTGADSLVELNYDGNRLGLFPEVMLRLGGELHWSRFTLGADARQVGRIHVDNSEEVAASIDPYTVLDLVAGVRIPWAAGPAMELTFHLYNALDALYETGGYTYFYGGVKYPEFIPAATRTALVQLRMDF
jgi:iron complex outermembrane receptor protein